jgi:hypothetical protein
MQKSRRTDPAAFPFSPQGALSRSLVTLTDFGSGLLERGFGLCAESGDAADDGDCDQSSNEAVFNGRCARLVIHKTCKHLETPINHDCVADCSQQLERTLNNDQKFEVKKTGKYLNAAQLPVYHGGIPAAPIVNQTRVHRPRKDKLAA